MIAIIIQTNEFRHIELRWHHLDFWLISFSVIQEISVFLALSILLFPDVTCKSTYLDWVTPVAISASPHSRAGALGPDTARFLCSLSSSAVSPVGGSEIQQEPLWPYSLASGITQSYRLPAVIHPFSHTRVIFAALSLYSVRHFFSLSFISCGSCSLPWAKRKGTQ